MSHPHGADRPRSARFPSFASPATVGLAALIAFAPVACSGSGSSSDQRAEEPAPSGSNRRSPPPRRDGRTPGEFPEVTPTVTPTARPIASPALEGTPTFSAEEPLGPVLADGVVQFVVGEQGGYGDVALTLGAPEGCGRDCGNTGSVWSLGRGGSITLRLAVPIVDGPGPDLIVFENPFVRLTGEVFGEPGEVSVSADGDAWFTFPCRGGEAFPNGCAGYSPVFSASSNGIPPGDPARAGGDAFDFESLPSRGPFRYVRVVDRAASIAAPSRFHRECGPDRCGFDLDAVVGVHRAP